MHAVDKTWSHNREVHRHLHQGMRGDDVAEFQHALNHRAKSRSKYGAVVITADGDFGGETAKQWEFEARALGLDHSVCTEGNQRLVRNPTERTPAMKKKELRWTAAAKAALAKRAAAKKASKGGHGAAACNFLVKRAGWTENPSGSNDSSFLRHWRDALNMGWMRGQPWCGFACIAAYHYTGKEIAKDSTYTPNIVHRAMRNDGFTRIAANRAQPGDLVVFNFPGEDPVADHVGLARGPARGGMIPTVEGNTSSGNGGSQANGGGVFIRSRPVGLIAVVARPK